MQKFDAIRPYNDAETRVVLERVFASRGFRDQAARWLFPRLQRLLPRLAGAMAAAGLRHRARNINTVADYQRYMIEQLHVVLARSSLGFTHSGAEHVEPGRSYLFISNHRDIVLDSALLNLALDERGCGSCRLAVGDNLLSESYVADVMRLNKSFVIQRSVTGTKALFAALNLTSEFIRTSLEEGENIWIAQREGRAKDGWDRTDPAVIKMLMLAWRKSVGTVSEFVTEARIVPVSISYELDPCDLDKAEELLVQANGGRYIKSEGEDFRSIVTGFRGFKGHIHLHMGAPLSGNYEDVDAVAAALDREIVGGIKRYGTHYEAARLLGEDSETRPADTPAMASEVAEAFAARVAECGVAQRPYLLRQYANVLKNRKDLNLE